MFLTGKLIAALSSEAIFVFVSRARVREVTLGAKVVTFPFQFFILMGNKKLPPKADRLRGQ